MRDAQVERTNTTTTTVRLAPEQLRKLIADEVAWDQGIDPGKGSIKFTVEFDDFTFGGQVVTAAVVTIVENHNA
jgi:hypothetical protein